MKRRIGTLLSQEFIVAARSRFYLFILLILAVSTAAVYFIPEEIGMVSELCVFDASGVLGTAGEEKVVFVDSEAELREKVGSKTATPGFLIEKQDGGGLTVVYLHNGEISTREANLAELRIRILLSPADKRGAFDAEKAAAAETAAGTESAVSAGQGFEVRTLEGSAEPLDNSTRLLLILLAFEVVVIGYLFSAVVIFQEKQEGTVRAFRVTPGSAGTYLSAKTIFWTAVGIVYGALMLFAATLISLSSGIWLHIMSAVVLSSLFYTLLGIGIAVYFNTISEWFIVGVMVLIINMLPVVALEFPGVSNPIPKWIPSYPLLFWLEEAFRGSTGAWSLAEGGMTTAAVSAGKLGLFVILGAVFAFFSVRRKILKEAGR